MPAFKYILKVSIILTGSTFLQYKLSHMPLSTKTKVPEQLWELLTLLDRP